MLMWYPGCSSAGVACAQGGFCLHPIYRAENKITKENAWDLDAISLMPGNSACL
jgi:hypothetical protein